jgi:putative endonuclease
MPWTYMLRCADGSFYVGSARNLDARMTQHALGTDGSYTAERRPLELVWAHESERIDEAYVLERKIKGWRREKRIALMEGRFADLPGLSRSGPHRGRRPSTSSEGEGD